MKKNSQIFFLFMLMAFNFNANTNIGQEIEKDHTFVAHAEKKQPRKASFFSTDARGYNYYYDGRQK